MWPTRIERIAAADDVRHIAVMPDVHLSGDVCVGLAVATRRLIYPAAVGGDIGCGMAAIAVNTNAELLEDELNAANFLAGLARCVPALRHSRATQPVVLPTDLNETTLSDSRLIRLVYT